MNTHQNNRPRAASLPIRFRSLDRVENEQKSKLLHKGSLLYQVVTEIKLAIRERYRTEPDRMDPHIELLKSLDEAPDDAQLLRTRAEALHAREIDLQDEAVWDYHGRAFVLRAPAVAGVDNPHITVVFFGNHPRPPVDELREIARAGVETR